MTLSPLADPERMLAVAYAPAAARPALHALWALDEQFASLAAAAREPTIALMRLVWWRDALGRLDIAPPPSQPVLKALAADALPLGLSGARLADLEEGWSLLVEEAITPALIARHAALRGRLLFDAAALLLGTDDPRAGAAGEGWALVERSRSLPDEQADAVRALARERLAAIGGRAWPVPLRALGMLAILARRDAKGGPEPAGAPARVLRALAHRLTGR